MPAAAEEEQPAKAEAPKWTVPNEEELKVDIPLIPSNSMNAEQKAALEK